jgi:hypothetical protein
MNCKIFTLTITLLVLLPVFSGCGENNAYLQRESLLDQNWGRSFETQKYSQMVDPEAGKNLEPVVGLDGTASENNVEKYRNSFEDGKAQEMVNVLKLQ